MAKKDKLFNRNGSINRDVFYLALEQAVGEATEKLDDAETDAVIAEIEASLKTMYGIRIEHEVVQVPCPAPNCVNLVRPGMVLCGRCYCDRELRRRFGKRGYSEYVEGEIKKAA